MTRSAFGRRFSTRAACEYLDVSRAQLRTLIRLRRLAFRQDVPPSPSNPRGSNFYFYQRDLDEYLEASRTAPVSVTPAPSSSQSYADVSDLMPATRRFM